MIENVSENDEAVTYFFLNMHTATNNKGNKHGNSHVAVMHWNMMLEFFNRCESGRIYDERTPLKTP